MRDDARWNGGTDMKAFRRSVAASLALGLIGLGVLGVVLTGVAWLPCAGDQTTEACYAAMGRPQHLVPLQVMWLISIGLVTGAFAIARSGFERTLGVIALVIVIGMNYLTECTLWLGFVGGHWDVPPGTGYAQTAAFVVAGLLIAFGSLLTSSSKPYTDELGGADPVA
ncbi:hypothetical protein [Microbacterium sp. NPDC056234]|uniref:hypothetical protein n=1 Tax=Microbacterium sp. NPDC056234 TaxID=3345757 RepID=UPI0035D76821